MMLPDPARSRAVLIGTSRFADPELPDLPAVRRNLDGLAACLRDPALWGLPSAHCTVVSDPESTVALVDPVHDAAGDAEDTLLVYYAGHGLVHPRTLALLLAVVSSIPGRTHTTVPYDLVRENVIESPAARKVVILDCCYSGRALGGMADPTTVVADEAAAEGTYVLASAPPNRQALSPPGEKYTAFTGALLTLFTGGIPNGPELLRLDTIYRHVRDTLRRAARPEPQLRIDNTAGELTLVRNQWHLPTPPPREPEPQPEPGPAPRTAPQPRVLDRIEELIKLTGTATPYACPVCGQTVIGQNLLRHVDSHPPAELRSLDPATLTLDIRRITDPPATRPPVRRRPAPIQDGLLDGRYQLGKTIGHLAKAKIHTARDIRQDKPVLVTLLAENLPTVTQRHVLNLAATAAKLDHVAIAGILDSQESETGHGYVVMRHVEGQTLQEMLQSQGPLESYRAAGILSDVLAALHYGHRQLQRPLTHGDVRPANVMLTGAGFVSSVKLLNYGFAGYLGHKQAYDENDVRTDLYSAGRLLYELLFGTPPPARLPDHPLGILPELERLLRKALRPRLQDRYQAASAMRFDLTNVQAQRNR